MELNARNALITGGSSGIGASIARLFAREGARVVLTARHEDALNRVRGQIEAEGGRASCFRLNVTDPENVESVVNLVEEESGPIDMLVNCAGLFTPSPLGQCPRSSWIEMIDVNLVGTIHMCDAVGRRMKERRRGQIVNVASVAAVMAISGYSVYCASKAGVVMYSRALARELAPFDVHVNAIAPGNTATPINEDIRTDPEKRPFLAAMDAATPSNRTYSDADDIARLAHFIITNGTPMYGSVIVADEGISLGL